MIAFFGKLVSRANNFLQNRARLGKLKDLPAEKLKIGHIDSLELLELIRSTTNVDVIFDIGANFGTWTLLSKSIFPEAKVYAFEPLALCEAGFRENTQSLRDVTLYPYAVGNKNSASKINLSSYADASSILNATPLLQEEFQINEVDKLDIQIIKLDDFAANENLPQPDLIKLDIQGYELEALKGARALLQHTKYVIMEVSFVEYYKEQPLFEDMVLFMHENHFRVKAFGHHNWGGQNLTQIDVLFAKSAT